MIRWMQTPWLVAVATGDPGAAFATDPSFWLNAGALGAIAGLFTFGILHSDKELTGARVASKEAAEELRKQNLAAMDELRKQHSDTIRFQKESHAAAMERSDDHVRQLILERDQANKERNEAVAVMRDFTLMAGAVLNQRPPWGDLPPQLGGGGQS